MTEQETSAANGRLSAMARARSRLEDVKALSLAATLLAFGGLTATVAVQSASRRVTPAGSTPATISRSAPTTVSAPDQAASPDPSQAPAFSAPQQAAVAAPATARPPIVSAQS